MANHNLREKKRLQDFLLEKCNSRSGKLISTLVKKAEAPSFDPLRRVMRLYVSLYEEAEQLTRHIEKLEKKANVDISHLSPVQQRVRFLLINAIAAFHTADKNNLDDIKQKYEEFLGKFKTDLAKHLKLEETDKNIHVLMHDLDRYIRNVASKLGSDNEREVQDAIERLRNHIQLIERLTHQQPEEAQKTLQSYVKDVYPEESGASPPPVGTKIEDYYKNLAFKPQSQEKSKLREVYHKPIFTNMPEDEITKIHNTRNLLAKHILTGNYDEVKELLKNPRSTDIKYPYPEGLPWHGWALGIGAGLLGLMGLLDLFQRRRKTPGLLMTLLGLLGLAAWGLYYKPQSFLGINLDPMWRELQKNYPSIFNLFGSSDQKATA
jgi:hypothetical protein